jgi:hypothetical protein
LQVGDCPEGTQVAADINGDGQVTGADVVALREMLLNGASVQEPENWCRFMPVPEWQFIQAGFLTPDEVDNCYEIQDANESVDFIQFNLGDLNGSCNDCTHENNDGRIIGGQTTLYASWSNGVYRLMASDLTEVNLYSLQIALPTASTVQSIRSLTDDFTYHVQDDLLSIVWNQATLEPIALARNTPLLEIELEKSSITGPSLVQESDYVFLFTSDAYYTDVTINDSLEGITPHNTAPRQVVINNTLVDVPPSSDQLVEVRLYDISGNLIHTESLVLGQGAAATVELDVHNIPTGIYLLTTTSNQTTVTERVFIND